MSRMLRRYTRLCAAAMLLTGFGGTCAFAAWSDAGGHGSGSAIAASLEDVTIDDAVIDRPLFPGAESTVRVHITNPHAFALQIRRVTAGPVTSDHPQCDDVYSPTGVKLDVSSITGTIPSYTTRAYQLPVTMEASSPAECQGAVLTSHLTLDVRT